MKKLSLLFVSISFAFTAQADQFKTVQRDLQTKDCTYIYSYPQFFSNSVPGYKAINKAVANYSEESVCEQDGAYEGGDKAMEVRATVAALNSRYVSVRFEESESGFGIHPEEGVSYLVFDANTGKQVDLQQELLDDTKNPLSRKVAEIAVDRIPKNIKGDGCFEGTREENIKTLEEYYFTTLTGLAKNKKLVISVDPPHIDAYCAFELRVDYELVKELIKPASILHQWLK